MTGMGRRIAVVLAGLVLILAIWNRVAARESGQVRELSVEANNFSFTPSRLEVQKDDLVKVSFSATDLAHSFTIDEYRIAKRAAAGQTVVFEFRADRAGTFRFYCNITQDERCRKMHGVLVVR